MKKNFPKILSVLGILIILVALFAPLLGFGHAFFQKMHPVPYFRTILFLIGIVLFSIYYGKWIMDYLGQRLGTMLPASSETMFAILIIAAALVFFYRDVVFGGRTFLMLNSTAGTMPGQQVYGYLYPIPEIPPVSDPGAIAWQIEPYNRFFSRELKQGEFPLWNPHTGLAGRPLYVDGQTGLFEPIQFLFALLPDAWWPWSMDIQLLLRYFLAGFFTYLFLRRIKVGFLGGIAGGIAFMLSAYFLRWGNHPQVKTETLLPLVLYGYERLFSDRDWKSRIIAALAIGWCILAAMPESTFFALFLGTLWYFYRFVLKITTKIEIKKTIRDSLVNYFISTSLGFALSAVYLVPFVQFITSSISTHMSSGDSGIHYYQPWLIITTIIPYLIDPHIATFETHHFRITVLFFVFLGLLSAMQDKRRFSYAIFFAGFALVFIAKNYGAPFFQWIGYLPILKQIFFYKYAFFSIDFALAILLGIGLDALITKKTNFWQMFMSMCIVSGLLLFSVYEVYIRNLVPIESARFIRQFLVAITPLCVIAVLGFLHFRKDVPSLTAEIGLILLLVVESMMWKSDIVRPIRYDPYVQPPFVSYLVQQQEEPGRIMGLGLALYPNIASAYGLDDVRWLDALVPPRIYAFSTQLIAQEVEPIRFSGNTEYPIYKKMLDLLNVKYIFTTDPQANYFQYIDLVSIMSRQGSFQGSLQPSTFQDIAGQERVAFTVNASSPAKLELLMPPGTSTLRFGLALPAGPDQTTKQDQLFKIQLTTEGHSYIVFEKNITELHQNEESAWEDQQIDLTAWRGKVVEMEFLVTSNQAAGAAKDASVVVSVPYVKIPAELGNVWFRQADQETLKEISITGQVLSQNRSLFSPAFHGDVITISGITKDAFMEHPPMEPVHLALNLPDASVQLNYSIGIDPAAYQTQILGDGVEFILTLTDRDQHEFELYRKYIDPKHDRTQEKWLDQSIDLTTWKGEQVVVNFETNPGPENNNSADYAYWGDVSLSSPELAANESWVVNYHETDLTLVYNNEVIIYENNSAYPRAFVVFDTRKVDNFEDALKALTDPAINLSRTAIIEDPGNSVALAGDLPPVKAKVVSHSANSMEIEASIDTRGLLIVSEAYDPGWQAYVDGKSVPIYAVDGILRGIYLDKGTHSVKLEYRPLSFVIGGAITALALIAIIMYAIYLPVKIIASGMAVIAEKQEN
ncbi:MAG: YfhO family protein [Anaerolineales bacterium]